MILLRYLSRSVLLSTFAVSATLLVIVMSGRFVKYLAEAAAGNIAPEVLMSIMLYRIPGFLELVLPLGLFIAILLAYGRCYVDSEMTVMSACGMSTFRLLGITMVPAAVVAVAVGLMTLLLSPIGAHAVNKIYNDAKSRSGMEAIVSGRFRVDKTSGRVTYVERLNKDRSEMSNVFIAEMIDRPGKNPDIALVLAERGEIEVDPVSSRRYLRLDTGYRYLGKPGALALEVTEFDRFGQLLEEPAVSRARYQRSDAKTTVQLLASDKQEDRATLQWRFSLILLVPIVAVIAQALSKTTHRRGRYVKMLPAFILYIFYLVILSAARDAVGKETDPSLTGLWWVHGIFAAIAVGLLYGGHIWRVIRIQMANGSTHAPAE